MTWLVLATVHIIRETLTLIDKLVSANRASIDRYLVAGLISCGAIVFSRAAVLVSERSEDRRAGGGNSSGTVA
jgi:hypothetical protein